jgi:quercetin dioxygenase-like cupin family protein
MATPARQITVFHKGPLRMVLFAFEAGAGLPSHWAPGFVVIHTPGGRITVKTMNDSHDLAAGQLVMLDPEVVHDVTAVESSEMLRAVAPRSLSLGIAERIDWLDERKAVEVGVARVYPTNPVLPHEHSRMCIVHQIAREERELAEDFRGNGRMPGRCRQHGESRSRQQRLDKQPPALDRPRLPEDPRVRTHAEELVHDRPGEIPSR